MYKGKALGDGCLEALPSMGLNAEALSRISLIDVIWLRQNAGEGRRNKKVGK